MRVRVLGLVFAAAIGSSAGPLQAACDVSDVGIRAIGRDAAIREIRKIPRYTQGLIVSRGVIYESAGYWGHSGIYAIDRDTGRSLELARMDDGLFGEGLATLDDRLYQLTWRAGIGFAYDIDGPASATRLSTPSILRYSGEGWGLTNTDVHLIMSDGSATLRFVDPLDFSVERRLEVKYGRQPIARLNELEIADGMILANIYGENHIVAIDPVTGCLRQVIDAGKLVADVQRDLAEVDAPVCGGGCNRLDFVLNGIAYDGATRELYLTGKNWPVILVFDYPLPRDDG